MLKFSKYPYGFVVCLAATALLGLLSGCAGQQVDLTYSPLGPTMSTAPGLPTVMIEELQNNTGQTSIGVDSDGSAFESASSPTAWVSGAIADELVRLGVRASYSPYSSGGSEYTIKGSLEQLWLEQTGPGQYKAKIKINVQFPKNKDGMTFTKTYNAEESSFILPSNSNISELMESVLRTVAIAAANEIKTNLPRI